LTASEPLQNEKKALGCVFNSSVPKNDRIKKAKSDSIITAHSYNIQTMNNDKPIPYLRPNNSPLSNWQKKDHHDAKTVKYEEERSKMEKPPPAVTKTSANIQSAKATTATASSKTPSIDPWTNLASKLVNTLYPTDEPAQKAQAAKAITPSATKAKPAKKEPEVPRFDIQQIPETMRKCGYHRAEKFMKKWFSGELNYSRTKEDERDGINQKGEPYSKNMVDTNTIKIDWLLSYYLIRRIYNQLIEKDLITKNSITLLKGLNEKTEGPLKRFLLENPLFNGRIDTWSICKGDIESLHKKFQFQNKLVNQVYVYLTGDMDMLASLGNFFFAAAIADATISYKQRNIYATDKQGKRINNAHVKYTCTINSIYVYAKDNYSFTDKKGPSQYLGHWNTEGVVMSKPEIVARMSDVYWPEEDIVDDHTLETDMPLYLKDSLDPKNVYHPFYNKDFRVWQNKNKQGGDFLVYSDVKKVQLKTPIVVEMPEWKL
jgi:hypothetical protein